VLDGRQLVAIDADEYERLLANRRQAGAQGPRLQALRGEAQHAVDYFLEIGNAAGRLGHGSDEVSEGQTRPESTTRPDETCEDGTRSDETCADESCLRCAILRTVARATASAARFGITGSG
jgi:hypothetical protein